MKAARWYSPKDIRVEEVAEPQVKNDTVKVKVKWCGICGSDLHDLKKSVLFVQIL